MVILFSIIVSCCFLLLLILRFTAKEESLFALWCSFLLALDAFIFISVFAYYSLFITVLRPALSNYLTAFVFAAPFFYVLFLVAKRVLGSWSNIKNY